MIALPDSLCYLDGEFLPLNQAKVSVMDRGFLLGDGVYESIPVYGRRLFRFDDHMARFERSLGKLEIETDLDRETWLARLRKVIEAFPAGDQLVYLQVTRGVAPRSHLMPEGLTPTVFVTTSERSLPTPAQRVQGLDGNVPISRAPRCWATCLHARSPPTRTPTRRSCCATTRPAVRG